MKNYQLLATACLLSILATGCGKGQNSAKANTPPPAQVQVLTLQNNTVTDSSNFVGTLAAEQTVQLVPEIQGRIQQILVRPGANVNRGDPIFILSPDQTIPQLSSAQAAVNAAVAARSTAVQQYQNAQAQLASAESQYQLAQVNNRRYQYLAHQGAIAQMQADQSATTMKVQADAVNQAQSQVNAAKAAISQAEANIRQAQANAATATVSVNFKRVVAPIAGTVGDITLKVGDYVNTGQTLTTINQNDFFDLQIPIPLNRSQDLRTGLPVVLIDPTSSNELATGNIYFVSPQADQTAQTILIKARFANANGNLRNSQYVTATVIWESKPGILIPVDAVNTIGGQSFVFVAQGSTNGTIARQVPVKLGAIQGQDYQVMSGLKPGDRVVVSGVLKLRNGAPIVPQQASLPPASPSNSQS